MFARSAPGIGSIAAAVLVFVLAAFAETAIADERDTLLEALQTALENQNLDAYTDCLHSLTREVPEYSSREAMQFWALEFDRLRSRGFDGRFEFAAAPEGHARFPAGSVLAHPIIDGEAMRDAIVLIQEAGRWKVLRLFS